MNDTPTLTDQAILNLFSQQATWRSHKIPLPDFAAHAHFGAGSFQRWLPQPVIEAEASVEVIHKELEDMGSAEVDLANAVLSYQTLYPTNQFIRHDDIRKICLKHRLCLAPDFMFGGKIPERNKAQIEAFEFKNDTMVDFNNVDLLRLYLRDDTYAGTFWVRAFGDTMIIPLSESLAISIKVYSHKGNYSYEDIYNNIDLLAKMDSGWVKLPALKILGHLSVGGNQLRGLRNSGAHIFHADVSFSIRFPAIKASACKMIVCPLDQISEAFPVFLNNGFETMFSTLGQRANGSGIDPIMLQPVPFGYLVVSKWGEEANIEGLTLREN